uniref:Retrotransposon gag domain-containing protein n=1 Tax=Fagus sylvatica TaxID=28930 RepID=A0A2N9ITC8_FAGSY
MSEKPRSVGRESRSPAQKGSSKTLYEPSWPTETPHEASKGASARAPPQHTDPNEVSVKRRDQEATSKGLHNPGRQNVHRVSDLKREASGRTPINERPRNKVNASKRGNPEYSNYEDFPETSGSQSESRSLTPQTVHKKPRSLGESSRSRPPHYGGKNLQAKKHSSRKTPRPEEQSVVWRALDLVSSSPFSREIEKARLPERYMAPRFEAYNVRTDPVAHIGHYQQTMAVSCRNDPLMCQLFPSSLGEVTMRWFNQLGRRTIDSWDQMAEAFVARFITNSREGQGDGRSPHHEAARH